jgi:hypothetical protein
LRTVVTCGTNSLSANDAASSKVVSASSSLQSLIADEVENGQLV